MTLASPPVRNRMDRPVVHQTQILIDGQWRPSISGRTFPTINPATEEVIAQVSEGDALDIDLAVRAARRAFEFGPWSKMDARDRGLLLLRLADIVEDHLDELAALETLDNGKPITDARKADLPLVIDCFRYYGGYADKIHGHTIPIRGKHHCSTRKQPVGVVGQIIPWNFPLLMTAWKWAPALAAGCTLVMKPAEQTPLSCLRLAELAIDAGFPPGVINVVPGYGPTAGGALVRHPGVDKIAFTGEDKTAQIIMREASKTLKRVSLELGGKSPNIIFNDADLDAAAEGAYQGLFFNQGQCCCAGSRVFVQEGVHDEIVQRIVEKVKARKLGDPFNPETEQGPQVDQHQFDKVMDYIDRGMFQGAHCIAGGERWGHQGYFVQPTVFAGVADDMDIAKNEIFGPVMTILPFRSAEEVIDRANSSRFGLAAGVWTSNLNTANDLADRLDAGTVWVNCYDVFDTAAPFGGFKQSGLGRELGEDGLNEYLEIKTVTIRLN